MFQIFRNTVKITQTQKHNTEVSPQVGQDFWISMVTTALHGPSFGQQDISNLKPVHSVRARAGPNYEHDNVTVCGPDLDHSLLLSGQRHCARSGSFMFDLTICWPDSGHRTGHILGQKKHKHVDMYGPDSFCYLGIVLGTVSGSSALYLEGKC